MRGASAVAWLVAAALSVPGCSASDSNSPLIASRRNDLSVPPDLATASTDLADPPDLSATPDLSAQVDLAGATDLSGALASGDLSATAASDLAVRHDLAIVHDLSSPFDLAAVGFRTAKSFAVGAKPGELAVGDFNEDGKLDVVTSNTQAGSVSILLGNGDGTLASPSPITLATNPSFVAVARIDQNSHDDIVVGIRPPTGNGSVAVMLGDGKAGFTTSFFPANGPGPAAILVVDVDGDAKVDIVMATNDGQDVATLLGNGDGTFGVPASTSSTNLLPTGIAAGHFFKDAPLDVVTSSNNDGKISVMHGAGAGGQGFFTDVANYPGGGPISPVVLSHDFNGDTIPDLIVGNGLGSTFSVLFGQTADMGGPSGAFGTPVSYTVGNFVGSLALADFNNDGKLDVAATRNIARVAVFLGSPSGNGTFALDNNYVTGNGATWVATGDFNNDGKPDIVTANFTDSTVSVLLNNR